MPDPKSRVAFAAAWQPPMTPPLVVPLVRGMKLRRSTGPTLFAHCAATPFRRLPVGCL